MTAVVPGGMYAPLVGPPVADGAVAPVVAAAAVDPAIPPLVGPPTQQADANVMTMPGMVGPPQGGPTSAGPMIPQMPFGPGLLGPNPQMFPRPIVPQQMLPQQLGQLAGPPQPMPYFDPSAQRPMAMPMPIGPAPEPLPYAGAASQNPAAQLPIGPPPEPVNFPGAATPSATPLDQLLPPLSPTAAPGVMPAGTFPGATAEPGTGASLQGWPNALSRLHQLGVPQLLINSIGRQHMTELELVQNVHQVELALRGGKQSSVLTPLTPSPSAPGAQSRSGESTPGPRPGADPSASKSDDQAKLQALLQQHASKGVPQQMLSQLAQAATSVNGLDATLKLLEGRMDKLRTDGWVDKFAKAGVDEGMLWQVALGGDAAQGSIVGPMPSKDQLEMQLVMAQRAKAGMGRQVLEAGVSLLPGVQAAEYLGGKNVISGSDIRRHDGMNQFLAGASALALGALALGKFHNVKSLMTGLTSAREGFQGLVTATGHDLAAGSLGANLKQLADHGQLTLPKTLFNKGLRNEVIGMGHIDAAARSRAVSGHQLDGFGRAISDDVLHQVAAGKLTATAGKLTSRSIGATGMTATHATAELRDGAVVFNTKLRISNGDTQLAGVIKSGGDRMAVGDGYLERRLPHLAHALGGLSQAERAGAGDTLAGMALAGMGKVGRDGAPARDMNKLLVADPASPALAWYRDALAADRK